MLKKSLLLLCLCANFSYSFDVNKFNAEKFEEAVHNPIFEADSPKNKWELYLKNTYLTEFAMRLIESEKHSPKETQLNYQHFLIWLTQCAVHATGKKPEKLRVSLEKELLQRKSELEFANPKRQSPPNHLAFLCLAI